MMGIDKIRVWDPILKEMTYMETWENLLSWKPEMYKENIVMHSMGLKLKGVEVYEEDVIKGKWFLGEYYYSYGVIRYLDEITTIGHSVYFGWVIEWIKNKPDTEDRYSRINGRIKSFKVDGNIYMKNSPPRQR